VLVTDPVTPGSKSHFGFMDNQINFLLSSYRNGNNNTEDLVVIGYNQP